MTNNIRIAKLLDLYFKNIWQILLEMQLTNILREKIKIK